MGSGTIHLYGGDIVPLLDLVASLTDQFRSTRSETNARYCKLTTSLYLRQNEIKILEGGCGKNGR